MLNHLMRATTCIPISSNSHYSCNDTHFPFRSRSPVQKHWFLSLHSPPFWLYTTYIQRSEDVVFCQLIKAWEEMAYCRLTINANGFFDVDGDVGIKRLAGGLTQVMLTLQQFDTYKAHGWHAEAATDHPQPRLHAHLRRQKKYIKGNLYEQKNYWQLDCFFKSLFRQHPHLPKQSKYITATSCEHWTVSNHR